MKEFGSDFHKVYMEGGKSSLDFLPSYNLYAIGRHAFHEVIKSNTFETIWLPSYYCRESLFFPVSHRPQVKFYPSSPQVNPIVSLSSLPVSHDDAVLVLNYFGLWGNNEPPTIKGTLIEDHSHDLLSHWALNSKADYCIASLRKTLPIAEGGILWSPKNHPLPKIPEDFPAHAENAFMRLRAMDFKAQYLEGNPIEKDVFLNWFRTSENNFDELEVAPINEFDRLTISNFDVGLWYAKKRENWSHLTALLSHQELPYQIIKPDSFTEASSNSTPFSLILLFDSPSLRDKVRSELIKNSIYPAILWGLPSDADTQAADFSSRMLSIHCDGRYSPDDIEKLGKTILQLIQSNA